jgi:hypothetical protein
MNVYKCITMVGVDGAHIILPVDNFHSAMQKDGWTQVFLNDTLSKWFNVNETVAELLSKIEKATEVPIWTPSN